MAHCCVMMFMIAFGGVGGVAFAGEIIEEYLLDPESNQLMIVNDVTEEIYK